MKQEYLEAFQNFKKETDIVWGKPKEGQISCTAAFEIMKLKCPNDQANLIGGAIVEKLSVHEIISVVQLYKRNNERRV